MRAEVVETLKLIGVEVRHKGMRVTSICPDTLKIPLLSIYGESLDPTPNEIACIKRIAERLTESYFGRRPYTVCGINVFFLKKLGCGLWTYRMLSWMQGPEWYLYPGSIEEIEKIISERIGGVHVQNSSGT